MSSREGRNFGFSVDISTDGAAIAIVDVEFDFFVRRAYLLVRDNLINLPSLLPTKKSSVIPSASPSFAPITSSSLISLSPPPSGNGNGGMYPLKNRVANVLIFFNVICFLRADPHFTTFSGVSFDYHRECGY